MLEPFPFSFGSLATGKFIKSYRWSRDTGVIRLALFTWACRNTHGSIFNRSPKSYNSMSRVLAYRLNGRGSLALSAGWETCTLSSRFDYQTHPIRISHLVIN